MAVLRLNSEFARLLATLPVAGWDLHPLKNHAFHGAQSETTPIVRPKLLFARHSSLGYL
jgi:hypothetical protein